MKKILFLAVLASAVLGLSATAGYALEPGCSPAFMPLLQHQADAMRARNRAYEREIINREESTLSLTCFDQAMALSARLGYIFSDNVPANPPPANTVIFTAPLAFPDWGATHLLARDLDNVITPMLDNEMLNFLPPWVVPNKLTVLVNQLRPILTAINTFQTVTEKADVTTYLALVKQIDDLVGSFATALAAELPAMMTQYLALTKQLDDQIALIIANRQTTLGPLLANLKTDVFAADMNCTRMDDLWNKDNHAASEFYPPEGEYFTMSPYYSLKDLFTPPQAGATPTFLNELANPADSPILATALGDLTNLLDTAGPLPTWPAPPALPPTATTKDIIGQM